MVSAVLQTDKVGEGSPDPAPEAREETGGQPMESDKQTGEKREGDRKERGTTSSSSRNMLTGGLQKLDQPGPQPLVPTLSRDSTSRLTATSWLGDATCDAADA